MSEVGDRSIFLFHRRHGTPRADLVSRHPIRCDRQQNPTTRWHYRRFLRFNLCRACGSDRFFGADLNRCGRRLSSPADNTPNQTVRLVTRLPRYSFEVQTMATHELVGIGIAVAAVIVAYWIGYGAGHAAGREDGYDDGKRQGAKEGSMRGYAVGYDRGRRSGADDEEAEQGSRAGFGVAGVAIAVAVIFLLAAAASRQGSTSSRHVSPGTASLRNEAGWDSDPQARPIRTAP